jgi:hypothetical protein
MITMEFDQMKKIWDSQNNEPVYGINEKALHNLILSRGKQNYRIANASELLLIIANAVAGCVVLAMTLIKGNAGISMYLLSGWMFSTTLYFFVSRIRRMRLESRFDRSIRGDLDHAISLARYQVRIAAMGRWNILPIGILTLLGVWEGGKPVWMIVAILIFFVLANYAAGWESRIYEGRKRELEVLKSRLEDER